MVLESVRREKFRRADLGMTGGNFVVAQTGQVCCVENEGNVRQSTTSPRVLVSLVGMEKLVPRVADLAVMLAPETPWEERVWLLQRYGILQYVVRTNRPEEAEWTRGHVRQVLGCPEHVVLELIVE